MYTILLVLALVAVLVGILFLYLFMKTYDFQTKAPVAMVSNQLSLAASTLLSGF
jgi:hypothetical protein